MKKAPDRDPAAGPAAACVGGTTFTGWTSGSVRRCSAARWSWTWPRRAGSSPLTGSIFWRWPRRRAGARAPGVTVVAASQRAAQALRGDTPPERLPGMAGRYFSYYREAYGATLGGLAGHFAIRRTDPQTGEAEWIPAYGLKAFSPIAAGYPWLHYPDFGAPSAAMAMRGRTSATTSSVRSARPSCAVEGRHGGGARLEPLRRLAHRHPLRRPEALLLLCPSSQRTRPMREGLAVGRAGAGGRGYRLYGPHGLFRRRRTSTTSRRCHLHFGLQLIFDESQKECDSEIWIDVYPIIELLASHCSSVARDPQTGRWERLYPYCDLDAEPLRSAAAR